MQYVSAESEMHRREDVCDNNKRKRMKRFCSVTSMMSGHFVQQAGFSVHGGFCRYGSLSSVMPFLLSKHPVCQRHSASRSHSEAHSHLPAAVQTQRAAAEG